MGIAYNVSLALFAGTTPLMATATTSQSGLFGYACLVTFLGLFSISAVVIVEYWRKKGKWSYEQDSNMSTTNTSPNVQKSTSRFSPIGKKSSKSSQRNTPFRWQVFDKCDEFVVLRFIY